MLDLTFAVLPPLTMLFAWLAIKWHHETVLAAWRKEKNQ